MYNEPNELESVQMNNRLFATFFPKEDQESTLEYIIDRHEILYNKIFILDIIDSNEQICTYNIDVNNVSSLLKNTISVHRKKSTNTLYSLNSLNILVKKLNGGILDKSFVINWDDYKNCLLLTKNGELNQLSTRLFKIISL